MTIKEIDNIIEQGVSLKAIAQAYSEIANLKIKKIRARVEQNSLFFGEIFKIYSLIRSFAIKKRVSVAKIKPRIALILTSNYRFYGNINTDLIDFFTAQTKNLDTDRILIGKAAGEYFDATKLFTGYQKILLKNDLPTQEELKNIIDTIKDYNQVIVFYPILKTLLLQEPQAVDITAVFKLPAEQEIKFIFEPELPKILSFFDSQILNLLLEQTFLEAEVARTASRFITMDRAESEANKFIKQYENLKIYAKKSLINKQILENFATLTAIGKEI